MGQSYNKYIYGEIDVSIYVYIYDLLCTYLLHTYIYIAHTFIYTYINIYIYFYKLKTTYSKQYF